MKRFMLVPVALLFSFMLVGCTMNRDKDEKATDDNLANNTVDHNNNNDAMNNNNNNGTNDTPMNNANDGINTTITSADDVANELMQMEEVESANVLTTANNVYVGIELKEGTEETDALETKVADKVRAANTQYENVYVSFNPDFAKQLADYRERINNNEPVEGLFDEFSDTVKRMFPDAK